MSNTNKQANTGSGQYTISVRRSPTWPRYALFHVIDDSSSSLFTSASFLAPACQGRGGFVSTRGNRVRVFQDHQLRDAASCPGQSQGTGLADTIRVGTELRDRSTRAKLSFQFPVHASTACIIGEKNRHMLICALLSGPVSGFRYSEFERTPFLEELSYRLRLTTRRFLKLLHVSV